MCREWNGYLNGLNESDSGKCMHYFWYFLRVRDTAYDLRSHVLDVLVADNTAGSCHCGKGGSANFSFRFGHRQSNLRNNLMRKQIIWNEIYDRKKCVPRARPLPIALEHDQQEMR